MFLRVKAWADLTREEKVSSRQQTPWQLQTATSLHSRLQPGGPQSSHQVRYDGAQVQRNPSTHCSPKGGQHRERRWVFDLAKVPAGTPAYNQILDEPPQLLLAKIFAFSANQTYIKKNYREFERNRKVALILSQQRGEHSRIIPQELCPPSPSPMRRISSVQFSRSAMSKSLQPHGLQHTRLPCPSPTPGTCSNSCPLSRWCHPTISSSVVPFSSLFNLSQHQGIF